MAGKPNVPHLEGESAESGDTGMTGELIPGRGNVGNTDEVTHRGYKGGRVNKIGNIEEIPAPSGTNSR